MVSLMSYLNPTNWGKTEDIVLLMFLNLMYASVILSCFLLLALLIIAVINLELQLTGLIAVILSGLILSVALSIAGLTHSSLTTYNYYWKPRAKKIVTTLFLVVLLVTEVGAFLFTAGFFYRHAKAEYIMKCVHLMTTHMVAVKIVNIHNSLLSIKWLRNGKMKNLLNPGIMEHMKVNHHYNSETLKLLVGVNNFAIMLAFLLFVAVNYLCIRLIVIYCRNFIFKRKITYV